MKFGKRIQILVDAAPPSWKDKFLAYKRLKKHLNLLIREVLADSIRAAGREIYDNDVSEEFVGTSARSDARGKRRKDQQLHEYGVPFRPKRQHLVQDSAFKCRLEVQFKRLLDIELEKLNEFFVEKEEEFVIKFQHFKEKMETLKLIMDNDDNKLDMINLQKDVVVFHGEMVLLENYCSLNYIGLVKIVKKHDRLTGAWLRLSFIPDVLRQPFYSTDLLSRLVRDCEHDLLSAFPSSKDIADETSFERETQENAFYDDALFNESDIKEIYKNTMAALHTIKTITRGSSTYNAFSVTPGDDNGDTGSVVDEE